MNRSALRRTCVVVFSLILAVLLDRLWMGADAFNAFGIVVLAFFATPILALAIYFEQRFF